MNAKDRRGSLQTLLVHGQVCQAVYPPVTFSLPVPFFAQLHSDGPWIQDVFWLTVNQSIGQNHWDLLQDISCSECDHFQGLSQTLIKGH